MPRKSNKTEQVLRLITKSAPPDDAVREETEAIAEEVPISDPIVEETPEVTTPEPPEEPAEEIEEEAVAEEAIAEESVAEEPVIDSAFKEKLKEELMEELREELRSEMAETDTQSESEPEPKPEPEPETLDAEDHESVGQEPPAPVKVQSPAPMKEREFRSEGPAMTLHQEAPPVHRGEDYNIVNLSEMLASELMRDVMTKLNVCDCKLCKADVLALTLNHLPQKYVTTDAGKQYMQLNMYRKQYETDVLSALTRACVRVKGSPRHS